MIKMFAQRAKVRLFVLQLARGNTMPDRRMFISFLMASAHKPNGHKLTESAIVRHKLKPHVAKA